MKTEIGNGYRYGGSIADLRYELITLQADFSSPVSKSVHLS